ncbi:alpha/beta hydrolase [Actinoplanes sp. NPDC049596]|uniref:alpha/beta fold hydrolase n=1 Tax=unclassified Actinoplanes TaxID=2626549 RepID=UPI003412F25F
MTAAVQHHTANLNGIRQHWVSAGDGPPVYLLHGFPETWYAWRKLIPELAGRYTVVAPDLRGYGDSGKPATGYDKRTMAGDLAALMDHLGHERAAVVGHDRGARVATRFAKDHPERIDRFVALDNVPTRALFENVSLPLAQAGWFFAFLAVPDLPEALIRDREEVWLNHLLRSWSYNPDFLSPQEFDVYVEALRRPGAIRGAAMDYRAAGEDLRQDLADAATLIACPVLTLWGESFEPNTAHFDLLEVWRSMAHDVRGLGIPRCGHLCHEERPEVVNTEIIDFLQDWKG